jgi:type I restriction-modification system DNA methylase subunit
MHKEFYEYLENVSKEKRKRMGIVYTPLEIVSYINEFVLSQWDDANGIPKVVDPCCGTGVFLHDMAQRISKRWNISYEEACKDYIFGYDIDSNGLDICSENIPHCNLQHVDSLYQDYSNYDIIVTNPPYVRIQNLDENTRINIQKSFEFCGGDTDIYIAFFENFSKSGKIASFICPNSWIRNKGTEKLRRHLFDKGTVSQVVDFKKKLIFQNIQTYTSIVSLLPQKTQFLNYSNDIYSKTTAIDYENSNSERIFLGLTSASSSETRSLMDYCDIKVGIATLCDGVYFGEMLEDMGNNICEFKTKHETFPIEKGALRKCIKASKISNIKENTYIIFPYDKNADFIPEEEFRIMYPLAYKYLLRYKDILLNRDSGKINIDKWFAFGRTQGLLNGKEKLLIPPMQHGALSTRYSSAEELYISGYAAFPREGVSISDVRTMFENPNLFTWVEQNGKTFASDWYGISKQLFKSYAF